MEHPARIIARKRDGHRLSAGQIRDFVAGIASGEVGDAQIGAFTMAVCIRGMDAEETAALTLAMRDSGTVVAHPGLDRPRVDKHSTGGVGDKVSLIVAPIVAACGGAVPMISGRGLGHTGGTLDKLAAIPGYRTDLDLGAFQRVVREAGFAIAGASGEIAPADGRIYGVRDVSGTVESLPLITSSILSKKLAEGIDGLVMDVKVGDGAFFAERAAAEDLARSLVDTGAAAGLPVRAVLTGMDAPLGLAIGNGLEVAEAVAVLRGEVAPADLMAVVRTLAAEMLLLAGLAEDAAGAQEACDRSMGSGDAFTAFVANVRAQGGDPDALEDQAAGLPAAPVVHPVVAPRPGTVWFRSRAVGEAVVDLGGGRRRPTDPVDPAVGVRLAGPPGHQVAAGDPVAWVHARTASDATAAARVLLDAAVYDDPIPVQGPLRER